MESGIPPAGNLAEPGEHIHALVRDLGEESIRVEGPADRARSSGRAAGRSTSLQEDGLDAHRGQVVAATHAMDAATDDSDFSRCQMSSSLPAMVAASRCVGQWLPLYKWYAAAAPRLVANLVRSGLPGAIRRLPG